MPFSTFLWHNGEHNNRFFRARKPPLFLELCIYGIRELAEHGITRVGPISERGPLYLGESSAATGVEDGVESLPSRHRLLQGLVGGKVLAGEGGAFLGQLVIEDDLPLLQYRQVGLGRVEQIRPVLGPELSISLSRIVPRSYWRPQS